MGREATSNLGGKRREPQSGELKEGQGGRREGLRTPLSAGLEHWNEV